MTGDAFLAALLLSDSSLPIGRFAHSHGLEAYLAASPECGEVDILELVETAVVTYKDKHRKRRGYWNGLPNRRDRIRGLLTLGIETDSKPEGE